MENSDFFAGKPDLQRDFNGKAEELQPSTDAANWPTLDDLDHLDLADRALTPGGELEYSVHRQVRIQRTTQWHQPSKTPSLTDEQELDFSDDFEKAAGTESKQANIEMSPDELKDSINADLREFAKEFDSSAAPDRGTPDR